MSTRERLSFHQCLATLFTIHNETFNVWSHLVPAIGFLLYTLSIMINNNVIGNPAIYPLLCFAFGTCLMLFSSAFAHLFCCISWKALHICFYIDYAAISVFSFTAGQGYIFYCRSLSEDTYDFYKNPYIFLFISMTLSVTNMLLSCMSRHRFIEFRALIRTGLYIEKFIFDISPFVFRCLFEKCNNNVTRIFKRHILWYAIAGAANGSQIPERFFPGVFDLLGHSHHFLHVFTALGNYDAFTVMITEMTNRQATLETVLYQPTFFNTFGLLMILVFINSAIVTRFVLKWLPAEEEELFIGSKYLVAHKNDGNSEKRLLSLKKKD